MLPQLEKKNKVGFRKTTEANVGNSEGNDESSENTDAAVVIKNKILSPLYSEKDIETVRF